MFPAGVQLLEPPEGGAEYFANRSGKALVCGVDNCRGELRNFRASDRNAAVTHAIPENLNVRPDTAKPAARAARAPRDGNAEQLRLFARPKHQPRRSS
jgi:hypothetical protein